MAFGRFTGDKKLEAQKIELRACTRQLESLERRIRSVDAIRADFADVWSDEIGLDDLLAKVRKSRELVDHLERRIASTQSELSNFDGAVEFLKHELPLLDRSWKVFLGLLLARQAIARGDIAGLPPADPPSLHDCQRALTQIADELRHELRGHIDELAEIEPPHDGSWPEKLDIAKIEAGIADVSSALETYRERLKEGRGELTDALAASLMDSIWMMESSILAMQDHRAQLAFHNLTKIALRNSEAT